MYLRTEVGRSAAAIALLVVSPFNATLQLSEKGFYAMSFVLALFGAVTPRRTRTTCRTRARAMPTPVPRRLFRSDGPRSGCPSGRPLRDDVRYPHWRRAGGLAELSLRPCRRGMKCMSPFTESIVSFDFVKLHQVLSRC
ncbi:YiaA/YiaB family inner membrane protein [Burkholderia multivorans]|uniref:YiaA/YiaB family inner membrane protein n=1 Tax=Burkholderia multivorans TaxID=87883 RepID=UPI003F572879